MHRKQSQYAWDLKGFHITCQTPKYAAATVALTAEEMQSVEVGQFNQMHIDMFERLDICDTPGLRLPAYTQPWRNWIENITPKLSPILTAADWDYVRTVRLPEVCGKNAFAAITGDNLDAFQIHGLLLDGKIGVSPNDRGLGYAKGLVASYILDTGTLPPSSSETGFLVGEGLALAQNVVKPFLEEDIQPS